MVAFFFYFVDVLGIWFGSRFLVEILVLAGGEGFYVFVLGVVVVFSFRGFKCLVGSRSRFGFLFRCNLRGFFRFWLLGFVSFISLCVGG